MQTIKQAVTELKNQKIFSSYKADLTLINAFAMIEAGKIIWQLNYLNPKTKKLVSFTPSKNTHTEEQPSLNENKKLENLNLENVKIDVNEILKIVKSLLKKEYSSETITKKIITLHTIKKETFWSFTMLTTSLKVLNLRINASSGKVISKKISSILEFKA
ncbi:MAG: hypothetical protein CMH62_02005 [Nanoarchaeota archaeon]|nr:hypothetical protein [Nanoarchaeota archaeon]|tara:strand:+ start:725 stop:1204 length:480 start_codon:yes stop_codon:yes gene_type:complete